MLIGFETQLKVGQWSGKTVLDPMVWTSSVANYIESRTNRDGFSVSVQRRECFVCAALTLMNSG